MFTLSDEHKALRQAVRELVRAQRREAVDHECRGVEVLHGDGGHRSFRGRERDPGVRGGILGCLAGENVPDLTFMSSACKCLASGTAMTVTTDAM